MYDGWANYESEPAFPPKKINKFKRIFYEDVAYKSTGLFDGAKVLKTVDGIIALIAYLLTIWLGLFLVGFIGEHMALDRTFLFFILIAIFLSPIGLSFAHTSPLKKAPFIALKKYPAYLLYIIILFLLIALLLVFTIFLTFIGLFVGLVIGLALIFYTFYRIFLAPGIMAVANVSPVSAMIESIELTRRWEGIGFFLAYFIILLIIEYIEKRVAELFMEGNMGAIIAVFLLNIPLFIIAVSITLYAGSFDRYRFDAVDQEDSSY